MPYAILRFQKCKSGGITARSAHNERKKAAYKSNPDIDIDRKQDNYHIAIPKQTYRREVQRLIKSAECRVRKDSTVMVETLITASPEFMAALKPNEQREFFMRAFEFVAEKVGKHNIISAVVHMDEKTPHMHLSFCPITPDNRLSAKEMLGNQAKLSQWQSEYHAAMSARWSELQRGVSSQITKRNHIPLWLFKMADRLEKQVVDIKTALSDINPINAKKQRDKALATIRDWLPEATRFTAQIKTVDSHIKDLEKAAQDAEKRAKEAKNNADSRVDSAIEITQRQMQREVDGKDEQLKEFYQQAQQLKQTIRNQETLISKIPLPIKDKLIEEMQTKKKGLIKNERTS